MTNIIEAKKMMSLETFNMDNYQNYSSYDNYEEGGDDIMNDILPIVNERKIKSEEVIAIETLIKRKVEAIDKIKVERKQKKEMYDDSFNNSPLFIEKKKAAKEALIAKKKLAAEIAKQPSVAKLKQEVDDLALSLKQQERGLSEYLIDYVKKTDATQLELFDGKFATIVKTAKLSRPKSPKKRRFR